MSRLVGNDVLMLDLPIGSELSCDLRQEYLKEKTFIQNTRYGVCPEIVKGVDRIAHYTDKIWVNDGVWRRNGNIEENVKLDDKNVLFLDIRVAIYNFKHQHFADIFCEGMKFPKESFADSHMRNVDKKTKRGIIDLTVISVSGHYDSEWLEKVLLDEIASLYRMWHNSGTRSRYSHLDRKYISQCLDSTNELERAVGSVIHFGDVLEQEDVKEELYSALDNLSNGGNFKTDDFSIVVNSDIYKNLETVRNGLDVCQKWNGSEAFDKCVRLCGCNPKTFMGQYKRQYKHRIGVFVHDILMVNVKTSHGNLRKHMASTY